MATLFEDVFNKASIYEMLFFNIKSVLIYPTLDKLEVGNKPMFDNWKEISKNKYKFDIVEPVKNIQIVTDDYSSHQIIQNDIYQENASYYPEFSKIVAITYATVFMEDGKLKRSIKNIADIDELRVINAFVDILQQLSISGNQSTPKFFPSLCGYNIMNGDIPLLIKRILNNRDNLQIKNKIPYILQRVLSAKPWDSDVIDVMNIYKFNGFDNGSTTLSLISDFLGLKKSTTLLSQSELSKYYWSNIDTNPKETIEFISTQSANQTNLCIQLLNELRQI
jgi:hypothetical protein